MAGVAWFDRLASHGGDLFYHPTSDRVSRDEPDLSDASGTRCWDSVHLTERACSVDYVDRTDLRVELAADRHETPFDICKRLLPEAEVAPLMRCRGVLAAHLESLRQAGVERADLGRMVPGALLLEYMRLRHRLGCVLAERVSPCRDDSVAAADFRFMELGGISTPEGTVRTSFDLAPGHKSRLGTRAGFPDMMSIPKEGARDRPYPTRRDQVIPSAFGCSIVSLDMVAADLRSICWNTGDERLDCVYRAADPYAAVALTVLGTADGWARDLMKHVVVPRLYGGSAGALGDHERWLSSFGVTVSQENIRKLLGRIDDLFAPVDPVNQKLWQLGQRLTTEFLRWLVRVTLRDEFLSPRLRPLFTVHDELILETRYPDALVDLERVMADVLGRCPQHFPRHRVRCRAAATYDMAGVEASFLC